MNLAVRVVVTSVLIACGLAAAPASADEAGVPTPTSHTFRVTSQAGQPWVTRTAVGRTVAVEPHPAWPQLSGASWIWRTPTQRNQVVTFWRLIGLPHAAHNIDATLRITADNAYQVSLNGRLVGANGPFSFDGPDEGTWGQVFDHAALPRRGLNVLVVRALNYFGPPLPPDNPAGLIYSLEVTYDCAPGTCARH
jgi:hypothetical protein